jgi:Flp pilus assembly protein protease CpaA
MYGDFSGSIMATTTAELCGMIEKTDFRPVIFLPALLIASYTDLKHGKIYNWLTYSLALFALLLNTGLNELFQSISMSLDHQLHFDLALAATPHLLSMSDCIIGGIACFMVMFCNFLVVGGGGGDVKLATAIGLGYGLINGINIILTTYVLAAIFGCGWLAAKRLRHFISTPSVQTIDCNIALMESEGEQLKIRMGPFFALAALPYFVEIPSWL